MADTFEIEFIQENFDVDLMFERLETHFSGEGLIEFMLTKVGPYLDSRLKDRFNSEGDDASGPWPALADATVNWRESQGYPGSNPINVRTGEMQNFLTNDHGEAIEAQGEVTLQFPGAAMSVEMAQKVAGAQVGQAASGIAGASPARPVLALNSQDLVFVEAALLFMITEPA